MEFSICFVVFFLLEASLSTGWLIDDVSYNASYDVSDDISDDVADDAAEDATDAEGKCGIINTRIIRSIKKTLKVIPFWICEDTRILQKVTRWLNYLGSSLDYLTSRHDKWGCKLNTIHLGPKTT